MPAFKYEALNAAGRTVNGLIEADNPRTARAQLREQKLTPLAVNQVAQQETGSGWSLKARVFNSSALAVWTRQLAGLVGSGLPLERALTALAEECEQPRQRELIAQLKAEVNAGSSFARALGQAPREFDEVYRGVVAAGESSGALGTVLESLADDLEERQALRAKLMGAMLYPAIVMTVAVVIVIALMTWVVPQVATTLGMLAGAGVPILKALQAAAETLSNRAMRADALDALVQVREGAPLGAALAAKKRFPGLLAMFARLGEQTGKLPEMLSRAGRQLGNEVQRRAMALATLLEPLLIVAMGAVVMVIVLSVLQPIIELQSFVR